MRPIESSNLRVDGIVETCINVAEINRAREFYQLLFNFEAMVSDERFCVLRAGPDVLLLFTHGGLMIRSSFPEASSLRMRHAALATSPLPFPRTRSRLGESDCASVESKLNRKFSGSKAVPACISGIWMPTCLSLPLQASGRIIDPANILVMRRSDPPQFLAIGTPLLPRDQLLARVRERTAAKKEGGSLVRGTQESDRAAPLALTTHEVRSGAVLLGSSGAEHQATGALPQPTDNTGSASHQLAERGEEKLGRHKLAAEKIFCDVLFQHPRLFTSTIRLGKVQLTWRCSTVRWANLKKDWKTPIPTARRIHQLGNGLSRQAQGFLEHQT